MAELYLSEQEIRELTGYTVGSYQLKTFQKLGVPAVQRKDGSVLVLRMHCQYPVPAIYSPSPAGLVSPAPQLKSVRLANEAKALVGIEAAKLRADRKPRK
jgi:hypothetical protein